MSLSVSMSELSVLCGEYDKAHNTKSDIVFDNLYNQTGYWLIINDNNFPFFLGKNRLSAWLTLGTIIGMKIKREARYKIEFPDNP